MNKHEVNGETLDPTFSDAEMRVPCYVGFVSPYMVIRPDAEEEYTVDLSETNEVSYNHGKLCRIVTSICMDEGKFPIAITFDGGIALPFLQPLDSENEALDQLNFIMCSLFLGGLHCEALDSRDIVTGWLHKQFAIWPTDVGLSANAQIHSKVRMKIASWFDTVVLHSPKNITVSEFLSCYYSGSEILKILRSVSPTLLLRGCTELRYGNLVDALSNLWIVTEQLTDILWRSVFLSQDENHLSPRLPSREKSLREDSRTWSTSVRHEILFQKSLIDHEIYSCIHPARIARNHLVHSGKKPDIRVVSNLMSGVCKMITLVTDHEINLVIKSAGVRRNDRQFLNEQGQQEWIDACERALKKYGSSNMD